MLLASYLIPKLGQPPGCPARPRWLLRDRAAGRSHGAGLAALFGALFIWGAFQGTLDVAMNTQAIAAERGHGGVLMSGLHGSWSIGSFAGAGIGALAVGAGLGLTPQLLILGTIALLGAGLLTSRMLPDAIEHPGADEQPKTDTWLSASRWSGGMIFARGDRVR